MAAFFHPTQQKSDVDKQVEERERLAYLRARAAQHRGTPITPALLDVAFARDPERDRKAFAEHFGPAALGVSLAKNGLIQALLLAGKERPPELPDLRSPSAVARFAVREVWRPVAKDLATTTFLRLYEGAAARLVARGDPHEAGAWTRDTRASVQACAEFAEAALPPGGGTAAERLNARLQVSLYAATRVVPKPSLLANLALLTTDQADLVLSALYRWYRRRQLRALASDSAAHPSERVAALREAEALDVAHPPGGELAALAETTGRNILRAGLAVALEAVGGGLGTFLWPGWGTLALQLAGSGAVYLVVT